MKKANVERTVVERAIFEMVSVEKVSAEMVSVEIAAREVFEGLFDNEYKQLATIIPYNNELYLYDP